MTTFSDRLNQALDASGKTRAELGAVLRSPKGKMGVSATAVGFALSGQTKALTAENAARAARFLQVDFWWLCTGEGEMAAALTAHAPVASPAPAPGLSSADARLLDDLRELLPEARQRYRDNIHEEAEMLRKHTAMVMARMGLPPPVADAKLGSAFHDGPPDKGVPGNLGDVAPYLRASNAAGGPSGPAGEDMKP